MKRFHVHVSVADLSVSIEFYSRLFGVAPTLERPDYAKWMLDDPRVNFAISTRAEEPGLDHLGIQVEEESELLELQARMQAAGFAGVQENNAACCYAESDKYWSRDPQGLAWESFRTLDRIPVFRPQGAEAGQGSCCAPAATPSSLPSSITTSPRSLNLTPACRSLCNSYSSRLPLLKMPVSPRPPSSPRCGSWP